jgi:hypothetical protein
VVLTARFSLLWSVGTLNVHLGATDMIALLLAATLAVTSNYDTVTTADGTRLIGTVVEESPTKGVTIQLADGTTRRLERSEVRRIEFADGSVTVWEAPAAPAAPPPAPAQALAQAGPAPAQLDTVFFAGGGRVRGRVLEEHPKDGVSVQLGDGTTRHYAPEEVVRIQYADGSTSRRRAKSYDDDRPAPRAAPQPPPRPIQQPVYAMPATEVPRRSGMAPLVPLYGSIGVGGTWFNGRAESGVNMDDVFHGQFHLSLEGGLRLNQAVAIGVYLDGGAGDVAKPIREQCDAVGQDCVGTSARVGFMVKHTWNPTAPTATWLGVGTGWELGNVSWSSSGGNGNGDEVFTYRGREMVRLMGGLDFRTNQVVGVGLYGAVSWGTYDKLHLVDVGDVDVSSRVHTTYQLGVKLILFP